MLTLVRSEGSSAYDMLYPPRVTTEETSGELLRYREKIAEWPEFERTCRKESGEGDRERVPLVWGWSWQSGVAGSWKFELPIVMFRVIGDPGEIDSSVIWEKSSQV